MCDNFALIHAKEGVICSALKSPDNYRMLEIVSWTIYLFHSFNNDAVLRWDWSRVEIDVLLWLRPSFFSLRLYFPLSVSLSVSSFFSFLSRPSVSRLHSVFSANVSFRLSVASRQGVKRSVVGSCECSTCMFLFFFSRASNLARFLSPRKFSRVDRTLIAFCKRYQCYCSTVDKLSDRHVGLRRKFEMCAIHEIIYLYITDAARTISQHVT